MYSHEPKDYVCPFCELLKGHETERNQLSDIVFRNELVTVSIAPFWWPNNPGGLLVFPNQHHENIYEIPDKLLAEVYLVTKQIALAVRQTYENCTGISTRQHNEPDADQSVWHLHVHVFPRYENDDLYARHHDVGYVEPVLRIPYAERIRQFLAGHQ